MQQCMNPIPVLVGGSEYGTFTKPTKEEIRIMALKKKPLASHSHTSHKDVKACFSALQIESQTSYRAALRDVPAVANPYTFLLKLPRHQMALRTLCTLVPLTISFARWKRSWVDANDIILRAKVLAENEEREKKRRQRQEAVERGERDGEEDALFEELNEDEKWVREGIKKAKEEKELEMRRFNSVLKIQLMARQRRARKRVEIKRIQKRREVGATKFQSAFRGFCARTRLADKERLKLLRNLKQWAMSNKTQKLLQRPELQSTNDQTLIHRAIYLASFASRPLKSLPLYKELRETSMRVLTRQRELFEGHAFLRTEYKAIKSERRAMQKEEARCVLAWALENSRQKAANKSKEEKEAMEQRKVYEEKKRKNRQKAAKVSAGSNVDQHYQRLERENMFREEWQTRQTNERRVQRTIRMRLAENEIMLQEEIATRKLLEAESRLVTAALDLDREKEKVKTAKRIGDAKFGDGGKRLGKSIKELERAAAEALARTNQEGGGGSSSPQRKTMAVDADILAQEGSSFRVPFFLHKRQEEVQFVEDTPWWNVDSGAKNNDNLDESKVSKILLAHKKTAIRTSNDKLLLASSHLKLEASALACKSQLSALRCRRSERKETHRKMCASISLFEQSHAKLMALRGILQSKKIVTRMERKKTQVEAEMMETILTEQRVALIRHCRKLEDVYPRELTLLLELLDVDESLPSAISKPSIGIVRNREGIPLSDDMHASASNTIFFRRVLFSNPSDQKQGASYWGSFIASKCKRAGSLPPMFPSETSKHNATSFLAKGEVVMLSHEAKLSNKTSTTGSGFKAPKKKGGGLYEAKRGSSAARSSSPTSSPSAKKSQSREHFDVAGFNYFLAPNVFAYDFLQWAKLVKSWCAMCNDWIALKEGNWRDKNRASIICFLQRFNWLRKCNESALDDEPLNPNVDLVEVEDASAAAHAQGDDVLDLYEILLCRTDISITLYDPANQRTHNCTLSSSQAEELFGRHPASLAALFLLKKRLEVVVEPKHEAAAAGPADSLELFDLSLNHRPSSSASSKNEDGQSSLWKKNQRRSSRPSTATSVSSDGAYSSESAGSSRSSTPVRRRGVGGGKAQDSPGKKRVAAKVVEEKGARLRPLLPEVEIHVDALADVASFEEGLSPLLQSFSLGAQLVQAVGEEMRQLSSLLALLATKKCLAQQTNGEFAIDYASLEPGKLVKTVISDLDWECLVPRFMRPVCRVLEKAGPEPFWRKLKREQQSGHKGEYTKINEKDERIEVIAKKAYYLLRSRMLLTRRSKERFMINERTTLDRECMLWEDGLAKYVHEIEKRKRRFLMMTNLLKCLPNFATPKIAVSRAPNQVAAVAAARRKSELFCHLSSRSDGKEVASSEMIALDFISALTRKRSWITGEHVQPQEVSAPPPTLAKGRQASSSSSSSSSNTPPGAHVAEAWIFGGINKGVFALLRVVDAPLVNPRGLAVLEILCTQGAAVSRAAYQSKRPLCDDDRSCFAHYTAESGRNLSIAAFRRLRVEKPKAELPQAEDLCIVGCTSIHTERYNWIEARKRSMIVIIQGLFRIAKARTLVRAKRRTEMMIKKKKKKTL